MLHGHVHLRVKCPVASAQKHGGSRDGSTRPSLPLWTSLPVLSHALPGFTAAPPAAGPAGP